MSISKKRRKGPNLKQPLNDNIMHHLDSLYRSARREKNFSAAFKAIELCLKAKTAALKADNALLGLADLGAFELEQAIEILSKDVGEEV